jgi:hypothetical protein
MKTTAQKMTSAFLFVIFSILIVTTFWAHAEETGTVDNFAQNSSAAAKQDTQTLSGLENKFLIEESAFHRFFKPAKDNLNVFGQQLAYVFSHYSAAPSEIAKALNHLTGGKGMGHLTKISLLFLMLIAIGFGVEKIINIPMKKYKQQLQSSVPTSFIQLAARLSARTLMDLISFVVFALTIVGLYLLFFPTQSPLYELAMVYLPPIFFIRLAFIVLNALYSPTAPHMRISPQNCPSAAMYFIGFMAFIVISLFTTKTLLLLKTHGMSEGVFLLLYSHLGLFQFIILLAMVWMDRARITRLILKEQNDAESPSPSSGSRIKRLPDDSEHPLRLSALFHRQPFASDCLRADRTYGPPHCKPGYPSKRCRYIRIRQNRSATGAGIRQPRRWFVRSERITFQTQPGADSKPDGHSHRLRPVFLGDESVGAGSAAGSLSRPVCLEHFYNPPVGLCGLGNLPNDHRSQARGGPTSIRTRYGGYGRRGRRITQGNSSGPSAQSYPCVDRGDRYPDHPERHWY